MSHRLIFNITIVFSIVFLPWWLGALAALLSILFVSKFYELLIWGALYDIIFGVGGSESFMYWGVAAGAVLFVVSYFLRERLIANR